MNNRRPVLHYVRFTSPEERKEYEDFYEQLLVNDSEVVG